MTNLNKKTSDFMSESSEVEESKDQSAISKLEDSYKDLIKNENYKGSNAQRLESVLPLLQEAFEGIVESRSYFLDVRMTGNLISAISRMTQSAHKSIADKGGEAKAWHEELVIDPSNIKLDVQLSNALDYQDKLEAQVVIYKEMQIVAEISYLNKAKKMYVPYPATGNVVKMQQQTDTMARYNAKQEEQKARKEAYKLTK